MKTFLRAIAVCTAMFAVALAVSISPLAPILKAMWAIEYTTAEAASNPNNVLFSPNIATLKALGFASAFYPVVYLQGYNTPGDGGGGPMMWVSASTATAEPCVTFAATGVTTGRWVRQLNGAPLWVEACGAYHDGTNASATLAAFQAANDYVAASANPNQTILMTGPHYDFGTASTGVVKASSFFGPNWVGGGSSTGPGGTEVSYNPGSEAAAFLFVGGSGGLCGCGISGVWFNGGASNEMDAVELDGQDGVNIDIAVYTPYFRAVLLNNKLSGQFTEFDRIKLRTVGTQTALEYRVISGGVSFHGSGLVAGSVIDFGCNNTPAIIVGADAFPYAAPLTADFFPATGNCSIVQNNSDTADGEDWFVGDIGVEQGAAGNITDFSVGDGILLGNSSFFGNSFQHFAGNLYLANSFGSTSSSLGIVSFKPINRVGNVAVTTTYSWPTNAQNQSWQISLYVFGSGYYANKTFNLILNAGTGNFTITNPIDTIATDTNGYGDIDITAATSSGFSFTSTSTSYPSSGLVYTLTLTQLDQSTSFHGQ